jgi:beta-lactamase class A
VNRSRTLRLAAVGLLTTLGASACVETTTPGPSATSTGTTPGAPATTASATPTPVDRDAAFTALEADHGARIGVLAVDTADGRTVSYRGGERFPFASTNKTFIAAAVLDASSAADLDEVVHYSPADLLDYAPVTEQHVGTGMTVRQLIDAALRYSDNTAANLLVARLGGPGRVQDWLRGIGDRTTNVDRVEPDLNEALPGDDRDTTTPAAAAADLGRVLVDRGTLDPADRTLLLDTMRGNTTGDATIRAAVPDGWSVADKTGTGEYGTRDDIAVVTPPGRAPIVVTVFTTHDSADAEPDDALVAAAARIALDALA